MIGKVNSIRLVLWFLPKNTLRLSGLRTILLGHLERTRRTRSDGCASGEFVHECVRKVFGRATHARRGRYKDVSRPPDLTRSRPQFRTLVQLAS